ncbi:hypothetical protein DCAR_0312037 [Daucus carota subsp. sativus]|nr:hypothetical protein DCAR_0312037 [Daucus carota subsp. sativus]
MEEDLSITPYMSSDRVNDLANWLGLSVSAAFFASLERFSCVHLNTADTDDEDDDEGANENPLMLTILPSPSVSSSISASIPVTSLPV